MTSQFEEYLPLIHDQEIPTKYLINKRQKEAAKETTCDTKCKSCKHSTEDVNNIIISSPEISGPLIRNLQIMYPQYKFNNKFETEKLFRKLQNVSVPGTVKICKNLKLS